MSKKQAKTSTRAADPEVSQLDQSMPTSACGYQFHPRANIFPLMDPKPFAELVADIHTNGLNEPIWLIENKIIDGRNRALACQQLGIEPKTRQWQGVGTPLDFVISTNLHRRQLSPSQLALVAADLKPLFEEEARIRMHAGKASDPESNLPQGKARDLAAQLTGVSATTVDFASQVKQKGVPALVAAVQAGTVAVSAAAELAARPPAEQIKILNGGPAAVKKKAKLLRAARKAKSKPKGKGQQAAFATGDVKPRGISATAAVAESPAELAAILVKRLGVEAARVHLSAALKALGELDHTGQQPAPMAPETISGDGNGPALTTPTTDTIPADNANKGKSTPKKSKTPRARKPRGIGIFDNLPSTKNEPLWELQARCWD